MARLSGHQFAVILASEAAAGKFAETAEQIRKALKSPFNFGERDLSLTASIGVTIYDGNPATADDVLRDAELAMYYAKRLGGDRIAGVSRLRSLHRRLCGPAKKISIAACAMANSKCSSSPSWTSIWARSPGPKR